MEAVRVRFHKANLWPLKEGPREQPEMEAVFLPGFFVRQVSLLVHTDHYLQPCFTHQQTLSMKADHNTQPSQQNNCLTETTVYAVSY